jgi:hypothetical protein
MVHSGAFGIFGMTPLVRKKDCRARGCWQERLPAKELVEAPGLEQPISQLLEIDRLDRRYRHRGRYA